MKSTLLAVVATAAVARAGQSLEDVAIAQHNALRAKHGAGPLTWSTDLASIAQGHTSSCQFTHKTDGGSYGQNLYEQSFTSGSAPDPAECLSDGIATTWYANELPKFANNYGIASPSAGFSDWGHYTQIVWKSTTEVGCAYTTCSGFLLFECNYRVAGNMAGEYDTNVFPAGTGTDDTPLSSSATTVGSGATATPSIIASTIASTLPSTTPAFNWASGNVAIPPTNNNAGVNWGGWRRALSEKRAEQPEVRDSC